VLEMGLIDRISVHADEVKVELVLTSFSCLYVGVLQKEIRVRLERALGRTVDVQINHGALWQPARLAASATDKLMRISRLGEERPRHELPVEDGGGK